MVKLQSSRYRATHWALEPEDVGQFHEVERLFQLFSEPGKPALVDAFGHKIEMPEQLYHVMRVILQTLLEGRGINIIPKDEQLTTQAAANMLGVSRPYFVEQLLKTGKIPYTYANSHRRIALADLLRYMAERDRERHEALSQITQKVDEEGFYDEE